MAKIDLDRIVSVVAASASDSRPCMKETLIKLLGLDAEATEEKILEALKAKLDRSDILKALDLKDEASDEDIVTAIKAAKEAADEDGTSLEDRAKAEGKAVVDAKKYEQTVADAKAGKEAADKLHQREFDDAYKACLDGVQVDSKDETRKEWQELYDAAPEATLKRLKGLPKLASTAPSGKGGGPGAGGEAPDGVDEDRHELNEKVKARAKEDKIPYEEALELVLAEEVED